MELGEEWPKQKKSILTNVTKYVKVNRKKFILQRQQAGRSLANSYRKKTEK